MPQVVQEFIAQPGALGFKEGGKEKRREGVGKAGVGLFSYNQGGC
jgi:hypothetical protein